MEDRLIIEQFFSRNEEAITFTKERYGDRLHRLAFRILANHEDAEECVNDTYLKAWESIPPKKPDYFFAYLAKICRNTALHRLERSKARKRDVTVTALTEELSCCVPDTPAFERLEEQELGEKISQFLKTVSRDNRIIFVRRYFLSEAVTEIAAALGVSESKVKSSLFRTRNKLRDYLSKEELL